MIDERGPQVPTGITPVQAEALRKLACQRTQARFDRMRPPDVPFDSRTPEKAAYRKAWELLYEEALHPSPELRQAVSALAVARAVARRDGAPLPEVPAVLALAPLVPLRLSLEQTLPLPPPLGRPATHHEQPRSPASTYPPNVPSPPRAGRTRVPQRVPAAFAAVMLLVAIGYLPSGYYEALRWVVCAAGILTAVACDRSKHPAGATLLFVIVAMLWNPLIPVYLERSIWLPLDILGAALFFWGATFAYQTTDSGT